MDSKLEEASHKLQLANSLLLPLATPCNYSKARPHKNRLINMESKNEKEIRARTNKDRTQPSNAPSSTLPLQSELNEFFTNPQNRQNLEQNFQISILDAKYEEGLQADHHRDCNMTYNVTGCGEDQLASPRYGRPRQTWSNHLDFIITLLGFAVGLGNLWRFPYLCFQHGGGAFLIPYVIFMVCCGAPLFFLEISLGQFSQQGAIKCWDILPICRGVGIASTLIVFYCNTYYIVILAWAAFYLLSSFIVPLEFSSCNNSWNTADCYEITNNISSNMFKANGTSSMEEFWTRRVLRKHNSVGVDDPGDIVLHLAGCLFFVWISCFLCIFKGIRVSGKIVYFTALFPYVIITCMIVRGLTLEGSLNGVAFYITPNFTKLLSSEVWIDAGTQIFFSYAVCLGVLPTLGSFNDYNNDVLRDSLIISVANPATSIFAGFGVFSILGHLAHKTGAEISEVTNSGPGLVFKTYSVAISLLPWSNMWAILFFFMIILLGFDSQFSAVESFISSISDIWPWLRTKNSRRTLFTLLTCALHFLLGLTMVTEGGVYVFEIWNTYSASGKNLLLVALLELISLMYIYGCNKYKNNIVSMLGHDSWVLTWFQFCWCFLSPLMILGIFVFELIDYFRGKSGLTYGDYTYPGWADGVGWLFVVSAISCFPLCMLYHLCRGRCSTISDQPAQHLKVPNGLNGQIGIHHHHHLAVQPALVAEELDVKGSSRTSRENVNSQANSVEDMDDKLGVRFGSLRAEETENSRGDSKMNCSKA